MLAIRKGCHFCEDSFPFYKRLSYLQNANSLRANLLTVMPDDNAAGAEFLQAADLHSDHVFSQPLDLIKVTGTPTLLLVDSNGRVERAWIGQLPPEREKEVFAAAEQ